MAAAFTDLFRAAKPEVFRRPARYGRHAHPVSWQAPQWEGAKETIVLLLCRLRVNVPVCNYLIQTIDLQKAQGSWLSSRLLVMIRIAILETLGNGPVATGFDLW